MPVATYFGKLTALWEELNTHEPLITCTCCSACTARKLHEPQREITRLHEFLMGLYSDYCAQLRTNILSQDPLSCLDRAYQLVVQDERVRIAKSVQDEQPPEAVGFAVRTNAGKGKDEKPVREDKSHLSCTHCKRNGHEVSSCFELHGYPEWWGNRPRGSSGRGLSSHSKGRKPQANATTTDGRSTGAAAPTKGLDSSSTVFTAAQWKALAGFIGNTIVHDNRLSGPVEGADWNGC